MPRDQPGLLHVPSATVTLGARDTEHHGKEFVFELKLIGADAIMCLQEPPATPLFQFVQRVARDGLHDVENVKLCVPRDSPDGDGERDRQ
jgi:hypothetical protein